MTTPQPIAMALFPMHMYIIPSMSIAGNSNNAMMISNVSMIIMTSVMISETRGISMFTQYMNNRAPKSSINSRMINRLKVLIVVCTLSEPEFYLNVGFMSLAFATAWNDEGIFEE